MDKYKAMRPRTANENAVAAAAAAAHAAANMAHGQHSAVTAVSTVPMPAGVAPYPNHISQAMHPAHCHGIVRNDQVARAGFTHHRVEQVAEALNIGIVERRIDLIEHANRRWIGEEQREDQRGCRQGLLTA